MKVKELIELLQKQNPDALVVMSGDPEGNDFSELVDVSTEYNYKREDYEGRIGFAKLTEELEEQGYSEEDIMEDGAPAIVFWP
jgi:hypothetical protein